MFGGMVRAYRLRLSMTQEELASRAGLSVRGLRKLEAGQVTRPQPNTVRLLADAFALTGEERDRFCRSAFGDGTDLPAGHRTPVPPRQLPATTYAFTGRAEELAVLDRLKDDSTGRPARLWPVRLSGLRSFVCRATWAGASWSGRRR